MQFMQRFDVFVSHSSVDKPWVRKLIDDLVTHYGVSVWLDENEIRPGDPFADALEKGIEQSRAVALVVSPESMASGWVKEEYYRALSLAQGKDRRLQLIPVLLHTAAPPGFLGTRNRVDFRDPSDYATGVWRLAWGITGHKPARKIDLSYPVVPGAGMTAAAVAPAPAPAPARPAPARPTPAPNREAALIRLLTDAFDGSASELQQWIRLGLGAEVFNSLSLGSSLSQLAFDTVLAVQQRGLVNRAMFESLLAERPGRAAQIRDVARLYGVTLAP
jgi:hypothetical protein